MLPVTIVMVVVQQKAVERKHALPVMEAVTLHAYNRRF